ncbi:MAG: hypothetical protein KME17_30200 [Cyanosarcina radialis HA8281-LM2]|nr:hypothetical protein [Cyanosarcina radialis HA8281-LM2]
MSLRQHVKFLTSQRSFLLSLVAILGCAGTYWSIQAVLTDPAEGIPPSVGQSGSTQIRIAINRRRNESYRSMIDRAEAASKTAAQRQFRQNGVLTDIGVMVVGRNEGLVAPILYLKVSRQNWQTNPSVTRWSTYFPSAEYLLGFKAAPPTPEPTAPIAPTIPPEAAPPPTEAQPQPTPLAPGLAPPPPGATPTNIPGLESTPTTQPGVEQTPPLAPGQEQAPIPGASPPGVQPTAVPGISPPGAAPTNIPGASPPGAAPTNIPGASPAPGSFPGETPAPGSTLAPTPIPTQTIQTTPGITTP